MQGAQRRVSRVRKTITNRVGQKRTRIMILEGTIGPNYRQELLVRSGPSEVAGIVEMVPSDFTERLVNDEKSWHKN